MRHQNPDARHSAAHCDKIFMKTTITKTGSATVPGLSLKAGEAGILTDTTSPYHGDILLRTYNGLVSLINPANMWSRPTEIRVEKLPPDTVLTIVL